ncbi:hypothetical protein BJY00DRAFT_287578, partial [Aspergillus carlsbadensis]
MSTLTHFSRARAFEIAIICALPLETDAMIALFDQHYSDEEVAYTKAANDQNAYTTGVIGNHDVVVAHMPGMGKVSAAGVAVGLRMSFPSIKLALVVGICGGVPNGTHGRNIFLGDVVISQCLVQYDFGRQYPKSFEPKATIQGGTGVPPIAIQTLLRKLETEYHSAKVQEDTLGFLKELQRKWVRAQYPGTGNDQLFKPAYLHQHRNPVECTRCAKDGTHACADALASTCYDLGCGGDGLVHRERPANDEKLVGPSIHIGKMGSGDTVMKSGTHRDDIARRDGIIAFEMEGAGVYAYFPSLVIKGVCDYADSHKNKKWQDYAAASAAACTKAFLKRWTPEGAYQKPQARPIFMVDTVRSNKLVGREDVMQFVEDRLSAEENNKVALVALGGIGKTRIALEYALRFKDSPVSVFWIHASTKARILDGYTRIAQRANIVGYKVKGAGGGNPLLVKEWLESEASGRWLIILDNADDHGVLYDPGRMIDIFPRSERGSILMTTRDRKVGFDFAGASRLFPLQRLDSGHAQELLRSNCGDDADEDTERDSCKELCEELEGVPLAIVQAAAFMHQNSMVADEYLQYYRGSSDAQIRLLSEDFEDSIRDKESKNPVAATWVISFENIEKDNPLAGKLLKRMSILDTHAIPTSLIETEESRHDLIKALGTLQAFCLITARVANTKMTKDTEKSYDLHRLVRLALRNWLKQRGMLLQQTAEMIRLVAGKYPDVESTGEKELHRCRAYLPHAIAVLSSPELKDPDGENEVAPAFRGQQKTAEHSSDDVPCAVCASDLMMNISRTHEYIPSRQGGIKWAAAAVTLRTFVFGESHEHTIKALIRAAMVYYDDDQIEQARMYGEKAVLLIEAATDPPPLLVAWKFEILGFVQMINGGLPDEYFRKALEIRVAALGPDHADVPRTKMHLSIAYWDQGRYAEYEELIKEIVDSYTRMAGPASLGALEGKSLLAFSYAANGQKREADLLRSEIAALQCGISEGRNLQNDLLSLSNCAYECQRGNYVEATRFGEEILEGDSDASVLSVMAMKLVATCYEHQGQYAAAEELRVKVMQYATKAERDESPEAVDSMEDLAEHYEARGDYKSAMPLRERIVAVGIKKLGPKNPKVILDMCELGVNYSILGQHDKAAEHQYSALKYPLDTPEARLRSHIRRMASIARELNANDKYVEAMRIGRDAVGLVRLHEQATQYQLTDSLTLLADTFYALNQTKEAEDLYREAIEILGFQGDVSNDLLTARNKLASLLLRNARYDEADALAFNTWEEFLKLEYPDKQSVTSNLRVLALINAEQGQYNLAQSFCSSLLLKRYHDKTWNSGDLAPCTVLDAVDDLETLALVYERAHRYEEANNIYKREVAIRNKLRGPDNLRTLRATALYRDMMNSQARYSEALDLGLTCKDRYQQRERKDNTSFEQMILANIERGLAVSYAGLGRYADAEPLARQALETYSTNLGAEHPQYLDCLAVLACILRERENADLSEVKRMQASILESWTALVGDEHRRTAEAMEALAKTCGKIGHTSKARMVGQMWEARSLRRKAKKIRSGLDVGLEGEEKKELDDFVARVLDRWDPNNAELASALDRLKV